jgi:uncharacterized protein (TIGR03790 family)
MFSIPLLALQPTEVLVLANRNVKEGMALARYYIFKRNIPLKNLLILQTETQESCSREIYNLEIRDRVRSFLKNYQGKKKIRCLAVIYGLPLKIRSIPTDKAAAANTRAAVDSELALLLIDDYPLAGWVTNPFFSGNLAITTFHPKKDEVLMVSRLDGPNPATVKRLIDDSLSTEKLGLTGRAYFDARWPKPILTKNLSGYKLYDASLHKAANQVQKSRHLPVTVNDREELFQAGDCPSAALYCGWYSLAHYIDAFTWKRGAIAYHIASSECVSLRPGKQALWCRSLLKDGVAATVGPVNEPYVQGFPLPDRFFSHLTYDYLTLAESYFFSLPYLSWQMVLVGDPLYTPFPF